MTPLEILEIRNKVEDALKPIGWKTLGAGVTLSEPPCANIDGDPDGHQLIITISVATPGE